MINAAEISNLSNGEKKKEELFRYLNRVRTDDLSYKYETLKKLREKSLVVHTDMLFNREVVSVDGKEVLPFITMHTKWTAEEKKAIFVKSRGLYTTIEEPLVDEPKEKTIPVYPPPNKISIYGKFTLLIRPPKTVPLRYEHCKDQLPVDRELVKALRYCDKGDYHLGIEVFNRKVKRACPISTYFFRGLAYLRLGKFHNAEADFQHYLKNEPSDTNGFYNHGLSLIGLKQLEGAVDDFTHVIVERTDDTDAYLNRALLYREMGELHRAEIDYTNVANIFKKQNKNKVGITSQALLQEALETEPGDRSQMQLKRMIKFVRDGRKAPYNDLQDAQLMELFQSVTYSKSPIHTIIKINSSGLQDSSATNRGSTAILQAGGKAKRASRMKKSRTLLQGGGVGGDNAKDKSNEKKDFFIIWSGLVSLKKASSNKNISGASRVLPSVALSSASNGGGSSGTKSFSQKHSKKKKSSSSASSEESEYSRKLFDTVSILPQNSVFQDLMTGIGTKHYFCEEEVELLTLPYFLYVKYFGKKNNTSGGDTIDFLRGIPAFQSIQSFSFNLLANNTTRETFLRGTKILKQGEPEQKFYIILRGLANMKREVKPSFWGLHGGTRTINVGRLGTGDVFGDRIIYDFKQISSYYTVEADTVVTCLVFSGEAIKRLQRLFTPEVVTQIKKMAMIRFNDGKLLQRALDEEAWLDRKALLLYGRGSGKQTYSLLRPKDRDKWR